MTISAAAQAFGKKRGNALDSATVWQGPYFSIPLSKPADGVTPIGEAYTYRANDASVGDLDGDGEYEIVQARNALLVEDRAGLREPARRFEVTAVHRAHPRQREAGIHHGKAEVGGQRLSAQGPFQQR